MMILYHYALMARTIAGGYTVTGGGTDPTNISGVTSGLEIIAAAGEFCIKNDGLLFKTMNSVLN